MSARPARWDLHGPGTLRDGPGCSFGHSYGTNAHAAYRTDTKKKKSDLTTPTHRGSYVAVFVLARPVGRGTWAFGFFFPVVHFIIYSGPDDSHRTQNGTERRAAGERRCAWSCPSEGT
jgi:hypothetical protein